MRNFSFGVHNYCFVVAAFRVRKTCQISFKNW